jgi:tetratricopeptide (TPR) repeat protein
MSNAAKHRKKAAEFEQLRQIDRAIASYVRAIEESEQAGEDVDVALLNKVGDLALRQGRVPDAITYYERAVEHYASSGLFNNAIALCNKILRNAPGRANVYFTLGRICAGKGLRGDATRNFLEYATRMQQEGRVDEGMRALAEVADLMPELTEVRRLVDEHADRAGIVLPRRSTPASSTVAVVDEVAPSGFREKSQNLVFLEVDYGAPRARGTPLRSTGAAQTPVLPVSAVDEPVTERLVTPPSEPVVVSAPPSAAPSDVETDPSAGPSLDEFMLFDPAVARAEDDAVVPETELESASDSIGDALPAAQHPDLDAPGDLADAASVPFEWLTVEEPESIPDPHRQLGGATAEASEDAVGDPGVANGIGAETPPGSPVLDWLEIEEAESLVLEVVEPVSLTEAPENVAATMDAVPTHVDEQPILVSRPPFRIDPHDFILPGELPPLMLDDALVEAGIAATLVARDAALVADATADVDAEDQAEALARAVQEDVGRVGAEVETARPEHAAGSAAPHAAPVDRARPVMITPSLPIAAVAAEAKLVATSRRDGLRAAVAKLPHDWFLRRRLAEALFEAGERDAGLAELEAAQQGLVAKGDLRAGADIADTLVQVAPERVAFHQKRVELSVRIQDQERLCVAYLDLADALVRIGEENRARAVFARVLEIDPYDDRARAALGAAAPPPPPPPTTPPTGGDDHFVDLANWLREEETPLSPRIRMREPVMSGDEQADFDALLRHFKEGVARSLSEDDYESHYDLGVAYKEMGLLDDAVEEFQKALRSRSHRLPAYEALGQCFVEQGRHQVAATVLSRALFEPGLNDEQRVGVLYLLAYSCEALQRWDEARSYYHRVYATDPHFRDAAARLAALDQVAR